MFFVRFTVTVIFRLPSISQFASSKLPLEVLNWKYNMYYIKLVLFLYCIENNDKTKDVCALPQTAKRKKLRRITNYNKQISPLIINCNYDNLYSKFYEFPILHHVEQDIYMVPCKTMTSCSASVGLARTSSCNQSHRSL